MTLSLTNRLSKARATLQKRRWLVRSLQGGLLMLLLLLLGTLLNHFHPLLEQTAFTLISLTVTGFLGWLAFLTWKIFRNPPSLPEIAAEIEKIEPEWMDSLICATEQELKPEHERRFLEEALISKIRQKSAETDFEQLLIPSSWRPKPLLAATVLLFLLTLAFITTPFARKGGHFLSDLLHGQPTGLTLSPGTSEAPAGTDVAITTQIHRWEQAAEIEYSDETGRHRFPMHRGNEEFRFTFYSIDKEIQYRILTPSLRSDWHKISSFIPPEINETVIEITPPAYTGASPDLFTDLHDFTAIEGSEIKWLLTAPDAQSALLKTDSSDLPLTSESGIHSLSLTATENLTAHFLITDDAGRSARTRAFRIRVQPDLPPTIEITSPGRDTKAEPEATVPLTALAADDFGLTDVTLHISISGNRQPPIPVFNNPPDERITEKTIQTSLKLADLDLHEGDVLLYFLTATDNREPESLTSRSEIYFIEIREESEPEEMEGDPLEIEQIDLKALIVEMKRLIRLSWQHASGPDDRLERDIAAGLEEARLETARIQQQFIEQLGEEEAEPIAQILNRTMQRMESASRLVDQQLIPDSIPYQEMTLADLVAIQTALEKNQQTSKEPSESSSEGPQPPESSEPESLEELQQLLREIGNLADAQASQNSALRRNESRGLSPEQQQEYQLRQQDLRRRTEQVRRDLSALNGTDPALRDLSAASASMSDASEKIGENSPSMAVRSGDRARASLLSAAEQLEAILNMASDNQIAQLSRQADQLAQQQSAAAAGSQSLADSDSPSREAAAALRSEQRDLRNQLEQLLTSMEETANQLRTENPDAAKALTDAGQQIRDRDTAAEMGRAENALLYRRFDRAAEMQHEAASSLTDLARNLEESAKLMPAISPEQLRQLLSDIHRQQQELMNMFGQAPSEIGDRIRNIASETGNRLGEIGDALQNTSLTEIGGEIGRNAASGQNPNLFRMNDLLQAAARSLEQQIFSMEIDRRARLQRQVSEPPERYRGLVEEYFKELSETP